jgi:amino acid permease
VEGPVTGDVGTLQASFNMMKVFVGIGILATPASFGQVGLVAGCMGMILIGVIACYTMQLQIAAAVKTPGQINNYSELGIAVLG